METRTALLPHRKVALLRRLLKGEASAEQLAEASGLDPSVVRRHMVELVSAGFARATPAETDKGRPHLVFGLTVEGRELFYARYDLVLESLATSIERRGGAQAAKDTFDLAAQTLAETTPHPRSEPDLLALLHGIGFEPDLDREDGRRLLISRNCPVLRVARNHPDLICDGFHTALLAELLGIPPPKLRQAISRGAPYCIHELDASAAPREPLVGSAPRSKAETD
jgi:predicted ArsR family transcriptional regulator